MDRSIQEIYLDVSNGREGAMTELLARLNPLIVSSIRKYYNKRDEMDDLVQEGRLLVLECTQDYRKDYSVPFLGFVKSRLKYLYLGKNRIRKELSLNTALGDEGEEHMDMLQDGFLIEEDYLEREETGQLMQRLNSLSARERQVVEAYYFLGQSIGEIASSYGIRYRTVINTKKRALERLRREMEVADV